MNKVILMGRLTRDPEVRYTSVENSLAITRYTLAVDRKIKRDGEATADFISCVAFGRSAEFAEKYFPLTRHFIPYSKNHPDCFSWKAGKHAWEGACC